VAIKFGLTGDGFVSQPPEMEAEALVTIIARIQRARKTGLLVVKRVNKGILEEGAITFVKGQVTGSETGRRRGQDAFNTMSQWKDCRFSFVSPNLQDDRSLFSSPSPSPPPPSPPPVIQTSPLRRPSSSLPKTGEFASVMPDHLQHIPNAAIPAQNTLFESALPMIDQLGSRLYRQIFLLIDGRRSVAELTRLTGRSPSEVDKVLRNLERAGIIRIAIPQE
jgi:hypothetical protein